MMSNDETKQMKKRAEDTGKSMRECYKDQESNPIVKKALDAYDALVKKLSEAKDTEAAKKVFEELEQARLAVQSAYQQASDPSTIQTIKDKASEITSTVGEKASEFTSTVGEKVGELGTAAKDTLVGAKEKLVG